MSTSSRRQDEKKRQKSRKTRRRPSAQSSGSELELGSDEDQIRAYEPTSPAQWSPHHRHSITSSINGRLYDGGGNANGNSTTSVAALQTISLSPIDRLPPELLIHIFRQLTEISHFYSCLFVSSTWCQCVVELLWLKPHLSTSDSFLSFLTVLEPGFNPNPPEVPDGNGEVTFDSREVLVNGQWDNKEKVQRLTRPQTEVATAVKGVGNGEVVEPLFPYARFVRRLNLAGVAEDVHDAHFACLVACVRLERLTLNGCIHLTDASLSTVLAQMNQLVALDLTGVVDVTDATIQVVATATKRLQGINLEGCKKITDAGIHAIADNCHLLRRIKLCDLDLITGKSVSALVINCPILIEIDLNSCIRVGEGAVRDIWSSCFHLRELRLAQCILVGDSAFPVPPKVASVGNNSNNLANLDQTLSRVILPVLPPLLLSRPLVHLRQLDLMALQITDDAVAGIVVNAPKLRNLVLAKCALLTDKAVRSIAGLGRHLQFLHLGHAAAITDASIVYLARTCVRLRYVDLACCTSLTNESVRALSALPKLRRIGLVRVMNLTDQAVEHLTARYNTLERVHLSYCEKITVKAIHLLLQKLDKLTHLSLTGVPAFRRRELQRYCRHPPSNFNELQRATFCVFSGNGIQNLRKYLESIAPNLHEYGLAHPENDDDGAGGGHGIPSFGDPQLSDTDDEGDDRDLSSHFLLPHTPQATTSAVTAAPPLTTHTAGQGNSQHNATTPVDTRQSPPQSHSLHLISRSQATPGTSRHSSRTQRNGSSSGGGGGGRGGSRQMLPQVPEAYAGMGSGSSSQAGRETSVNDGSVTGIRHRTANMGGSLSSPVVGALMHSRLQRSVAREEQRSQAQISLDGVNANASTMVATATGSDGRRGFQRWMVGTNGLTTMANGHGRSSAPPNSRENGSASREPVEISPPATTPSSATSTSPEVRGVHTVADVSAASPSSQGDGDGQANSSKPTVLKDDAATEEAPAASCMHHENASGRSTPARNVEGGGGEGTSRRVRREKEKENASTPRPSVTVALALDDLAHQDPSRTSTPSPSPSSHGVRRKLKGFNAAAASLFKGKERKT